MRAKYALTTLTAGIIVLVSLFPSHATATNYGNINILDDTIMNNTSAMTSSQTTQFLDRFTGSCLSSATFSTPEPFGYSNGSYQFGGNVDAGTAVHDIAVHYNLNPQVLLATLEKEQGLVDRNGNCNYSNPAPANPDATHPCNYTSGCSYACVNSPVGGCTATALGYACSYWCNVNFNGFSKQISGGAWVFRFAEARAYGQLTGYAGYDPDDENICYTGPMTTGYRQRSNVSQPCTNGGPPGNQSVYYDGSYTDSDGNTMYIPNGATASMLNYTPFYARSYTNDKLFHTSFTNWFGSTTSTNIPYDWSLADESFYSDNSYATTKKLSTPDGSVNVLPGSTVYVQIKAQNIGYQTWSTDVVHIGTAAPHDRLSTMANATWLSPGRIAMSDTNSIMPGGTATFRFSLTIPSTLGSYSEVYGLVADGVTWMQSLYSMNINVTSRRAEVPDTSHASMLASGNTLQAGQYLLAGDGEAALLINGTGELGLHIGPTNAWDNGVQTSSKHSYLAMQGDGNLVVYDDSGKALWNSGTANPSNAGAYLALQGDGNLVLYTVGGIAIWSSETDQNPDLLQTVFPALRSGSVLLPGQSMLTADLNYYVAMQGDGNLVLYSKSGQALWNSGTANPSNAGAYVAMQGDGNLVLYSKSGQALWNSGTFDHGPSFFVVQGDGNAVIYNSQGAATWSSKFGKN